MKYEIEIEGLPSGWKAVAYRKPIDKNEFILYAGMVACAKGFLFSPWLILEKIQPHRIVPEDPKEI